MENDSESVRHFSFISLYSFGIDSSIRFKSTSIVFAEMLKMLVGNHDYNFVHFFRSIFYFIFAFSEISMCPIFSRSIRMH